MDTYEILSKLNHAYLASLDELEKINIDELTTYKDWEPIDALLDRFERLIDFLFQQVFRKIYIQENLQQPKTARETLLFMGKIWVVPDIGKMIDLKDLRNKIAHEYLSAYMVDLEEILANIKISKDFIQQVIENAATYLKKSW